MDAVSGHMGSAFTIPFQKIQNFRRLSEKGMIVSAGQSVWIGADAVLQIGLRLNGWIKFLAILFSLPILKDCFQVLYFFVARYRKNIRKDIVQFVLQILKKLY
jgi:predicted DCC family thiol-disulfide oxidoreductase YuxK